MKKKIFINIIFEQRKYLVLYAWLVVTFVGFICIQSILLEHQYEESIHPDIELYGDLNQSGIFDFTMYRSLGNLTEEIKSRLDDDITVQGVIIRNLVTIGDGINSAEYRIWGMDDEAIHQLKSFVKEGHIPEKRNEVLIGSYAARYFDLHVGDHVPFGVTLNESGDDAIEGEYVVAGILGDNMKYYKGSIIVSKESFFKSNEVCEDNYIMLYAKNDNQYKKIMTCISEVSEIVDKEFNTTVSYTYKGSTNNLFSSSRITLIIISIIVMVLLFVYVLRGIAKKIGLLKALGLPDSYLLSSFGGGLLSITTISVAFSSLLGILFSSYLNQKASSFYGFKVVEYSFSKNTFIFIMLFNVIIMLVALGTVMVIGKRVSPRAAMLKG